MTQCGSSEFQTCLAYVKWMLPIALDFGVCGDVFGIHCYLHSVETTW